MTTVADKDPYYHEQEADLGLIRDLMGGTRAMRAAGVKHMPMWPAEDSGAYKERVQQSVLFPAYARTIETLASKPFSQPLTLGDDVPPKIAEWCEDIDLQGRNLHVFAHDRFEHALAYGISGILIDYPKGNGAKNLAEERASGARPYFTPVDADQILGCRASRISGRWRIDQLRLAECVEEADGPYGTKKANYVRVFMPGAWELHKETTTGWVKVDGNVTTLPIVPFVPIYGKRRGFMRGRPPLMEVAYMNAQHWADSSDQAKSVRFARVRLAAIIGGDGEERVKIGADYFMRLPAGASIEIAQGSAEAVTIGRSELAALEEQMRQTGAELLVIRPGAVTATQVSTENAVGMSVLQEMASQAEDAVDAALQIAALWAGLAQGGHVSLFDDYGAQNLAEASAELLLKMNQAGKLSDVTLLNEMQRRGVLSAEVDNATELERIAAQGPALGDLVPPEPQVGSPPMDGASGA